MGRLGRAGRLAWRGSTGLLASLLWLWAGWLSLSGCDEAGGCEHDGAALAVGESVDDIGRRLRCTCTAGGLACEDLPGAVGLGDAAAPDVAPPTDRGRPPPADGSHADAMDAMLDAMPDAIVDATPAPPPACPEQRIVAGSDCPRFEGVQCIEGAPFDCCGSAVPGERVCTCRDGGWDCADLVARCEDDPDTGDCGRRTRLCGQWQATRAQQDPVMQWNGDHEACDAGEMSPEWKAATLQRINIFRSLAGLPSVQRSPALDVFAQACALAIRWHRTDDHQLERQDRCYSPAAEEGVAASLISVAPALASVNEYMLDFGEQNFDRLSHRLYLLAPQLGPIGLGSTSLASCVFVFNGRGPRDAPPWVAWPPPGPFPIEAALTEEAGWSVHSNVINLARADVQVFRDGVEPMPIDVRSLMAAGPASWGLAWMPVGWDLEVGRTYSVRVTGGIRQGVDTNISYTVEPIDCQMP